MQALFLLLILSIAACEKTPKQARLELVKQDYSYSRNSMAEAIRGRDVEALKLFLVAGMEPGVVSAGYSMLEYAALPGDSTMVAILLQAGADPNASGGVSTPLIEAASGKHADIALLLLQAGANVNAADGTGRTALMAAAEQGAAIVVRVLLEAAADPNLRSKLGSTALGQAEHAQQKEVMSLLTEAGALRYAGVDLAALMDPSKLRAVAPAEYRVRFASTAGDFVVAVDRRMAPQAADRFFNLVRHGFFDGQRFFRVVRGRLVQFGLHGTPEVAARWYEATIPDDPATGSNARGTLVFAAGEDADSRTTQIFINLADNPDFDHLGFVPFARVVEGMEAVEAINGEYGELPEQSRILAEGNEYLDRAFSGLDRVAQARMVE